MDAQEPHLRKMLNFVGVSEQVFIVAEMLAFGPAKREMAMARAKDAITSSVRLAGAKAA